MLKTSTPDPSHQLGPMGRTLAAAGATLLSLTMSGTAMAAVVWSAVKLAGLPDIVLYVLVAVGMIPVIGVTIWTAGRAWHVENRLELGLDIDQPDFGLFSYFRKR